MSSLSTGRITAKNDVEEWVEYIVDVTDVTGEAARTTIDDELVIIQSEQEDLPLSQAQLLYNS